MTIPFKPRVAKTICRIDRKTVAVTANVPFEDIDLTINGEGSEVYDYERIFVLHEDNGGGFIYTKFNNLSSYSRDYIQGRISTASADVTESRTNIETAETAQSIYPAMINDRVTGYLGNKRQVDCIRCYSTATTTNIQKQSIYTADTSTELTLMQMASSTTGTITYSLIITAVPKRQYNPHAILLKHKKLTNQTADIIFGGVNDTEDVDDLDGDKYDYFYTYSLLTAGANITTCINEDNTTERDYQFMYNANGVIGSNNLSTGYTFDDILIGDGYGIISGDVGRKKIVTSTLNYQSTNQQREQYFSNPDTSTPMTSLLFRPSASVSGDIWLYAVPKGYNGDLTPWTFRQIHHVSNTSFEVGKAFDIPSKAMFARIQIIGDSVSGSNINLDFDTTTSLSKQNLKSSLSSTTASFSTDRSIGRIEKVSNIDCTISLKNGSNRPILSKSNYNESTIDLNGLWALNSSSNYTQLILNADNTNAMNAEISVSFI